MKKIEKKIKKSININNLSFYDHLPKPIVRKKGSSYLFPMLILTSFLLIFTIYYENNNKEKTLLKDYIIINEIELSKNNDMENTASKENLDMIYYKQMTSIEEINQYYQISLKDKYLKEHYYTKDKDNIIQATINYELNGKSFNLIINKNNPIFENNSYLFNQLLEQEKSIILNQNVVISKVKSEEYYMIAYQKNNVNYLIYTDMEKQNIINFLKEMFL